MGSTRMTLTLALTLTLRDPTKVAATISSSASFAEGQTDASWYKITQFIVCIIGFVL